MKRILTAFLALALAVSASAQQNARTAFFMNDYAYAYRFNPAFIPTKGHVGLLGIGNTGISAESNIDGRMFTTIDHPATEYEEDGMTYSREAYTEVALDKKYVKSMNKLSSTVDTDLISVGFKHNKFFHSIDLTLRGDVAARMPGNALILAFDAINLDEDEELDFTSDTFDKIKLSGNVYTELAYGLGWQIDDRLSVGARAKLLFGMAGADMQFNKINARMDGDMLYVNTNGHIKAYMPGSYNIPVKDGHYDLEGIDDDVDFSQMPSGFGVAFDLGASYRIMDGLTASLSVNDLGFISWKNAICGEVNSFEIDTAEDSEDIAFIGVAARKPMHGVTAKVNAAVEYEIPGAKGLSVGLLGTTRLAGLTSWSEGRLVLTYEAPKIVSVAVSGACSDFGGGLGFALNLNLGPVGLFAGFDSLVPLFTLDGGYPGSTVNTNGRLGLSVIFGRKQPRN